MMSGCNLDNYPELLEDLWAKVADLLAERGLGASSADKAAFSVTEYIRHEWSGRNRYFLKSKVAKRQAVDVLQESLFVVASTPSAESDDAEHVRLLRDRCIEVIAGLGFDGDRAELYGTEIGKLVQREWAGERLYIPKGQKYDLGLRDYSIWLEWNGSYASKIALVDRYGITEQRFYQIVKTVRRRHFKRTQPSLFPEVA